jgi:hypothetical protein
MVLASNLKKKRYYQFTFAVLGILIGVYFGVWLAGLIEHLYAPYASGSDKLDTVFVASMVMCCSALGIFLAIVGYRFGSYLALKFSNKMSEREHR